MQYVNARPDPGVLTLMQHLTPMSPVIAARQALARDWPHFFVVEVTQPVVERAGEFAETFALRGYDSVQLAAACEILAAVPGEGEEGV